MFNKRTKRQTADKMSVACQFYVVWKLEEVTHFDVEVSELLVVLSVDRHRPVGRENEVLVHSDLETYTCGHVRHVDLGIVGSTEVVVVVIPCGSHAGLEVLILSVGV